MKNVKIISFRRAHVYMYGLFSDHGYVTSNLVTFYFITNADSKKCSKQNSYKKQ